MFIMQPVNALWDSRYFHSFQTTVTLNSEIHCMNFISSDNSTSVIWWSCLESGILKGEVCTVTFYQSMWSIEAYKKTGSFSCTGTHFRATLNNLHPSSTCCLATVWLLARKKGCVIDVTYIYRWKQGFKPQRFVPQSITEWHVINQKY